MTKRPTPATDMRTLSDLTSDPRNANRGTPRGREALRHSLHAFGAGRAVLIDRHGVVIAGNKTVAEARAQGLRLRVIESDGSELIAVQRRDLDLASDDRAQALALADNRVGELDLVWDETTLQELHAAGVELAAFWTDEELAALFAEPVTGLTDENAVVAPGPTAFARGDLVALGPHRLLCGDATSADDVDRVLAGVPPALMTTDPPYGVAYEPRWRHEAYPAQRTAVGAVANDDRVDWTAAWRLFPGDVAYVWHAGLHARTVASSLEAAGFDLRSQIVWVKQHFALSRGHYHWRHEPCVVCRPSRRHRPVVRGSAAVGPCGRCPNLKSGRGAGVGAGRCRHRPRDAEAGAQLFEIPIGNHAQPGDAVYDPFVGSGTSIIAAEKTGRVCLALEIDPAYVQVVVTRWESVTGQSAVRLGGAR